MRPITLRIASFTVRRFTMYEVNSQLFGSDADLYFKAGMEALAIEDLEESLSQLERCLLVSSKHLSARYNLGIVLSLLDRCDEAMTHFEKILVHNPRYPGIYTAMGQAAFGSYLTHRQKVEQYKESMIRLLERAVEEDAEDMDAYFSLGNAY